MPRAEEQLPDQSLWERSGRRRRLALVTLAALPTALAAQVMFSLLPPQSGPWLTGLLTALFALLFAWISVGFWSSLAGALVLWRRGDHFSVLKDQAAPLELPDDFRTALLFPVYNEDPAKVAAGIRAVLRSLAAARLAGRFDVFMLSDTSDPDLWVAEEEAWQTLRREEKAEDRLFYRRRKMNLKRKSGNIADFCRRWGAAYRYMIIFDADSLMSGGALARLVQAMEAHPEVGIIQSPPQAIFSRSLLGRVQQFANQLYGPIFAAGLHFWQLGDAQYWGHNAIIRVEPFMAHCQLPRLPGRPPLGGDILSHDFVESALMRRAGYGVWLAYDLPGSWEQTPPSLIDELIRDRRWCQGNLQHAKLLFTRGFFPTHRALFINGIMSYGSALMWFCFLLASSLEALRPIFITPAYFPQGPSLFPDWPRYFPVWALSLLSGTAGLLFLPKILAGLLTALRGGAAGFGGLGRLSLGIALEALISTLLAPARMIFHSFFVVATLLGLKVGWNAQNRDASGTAWRDGLRFHWWGTLLGLVWGLIMYKASPGFFLWFSPVAAGLALSWPLSIWTSRTSWGDLIHRWGLLQTPTDLRPPEEVQRLAEHLGRLSPAARGRRGFARAVVDPGTFTLRLALAGLKPPKPPALAARLQALRAKALAEGPEALSRQEKNALLSDPVSLAALHHEVWNLTGEAAAAWGF